MSGARWFGFTVAIGIAAAGCAALPTIEAGVCGNAVIEAGETCDGFAVGDTPCRRPGEAHACRLDCSLQTDGTRAACPAGWGCAGDGVCRKASGSYRAVPDRVDSSAHSLLSGDFDGDGRGDVVSLGPRGVLNASKVRVHYFDREGALAATWILPRAITSIVVDEVSGDARSDAVFVEGRVGALLGQSGRNLISETYPTYFLPRANVRIAGGLYADFLANSAPLLVLAEGGGQFTLSRPDPVSASLKMITEFPGRIDQLAADPAIGDVFDADDRDPCMDVGLALRGEHEFTLYSVCERDPETGQIGWREIAATTAVTLEPAAAIEGGPLFADIDGDGHLDALIGTEQGLYVAFGDGTRLSSARPLEAEVDGVPGAAVEMPIAAGDFTGDGAADLIYPRGFMLSRRAAGDSRVGYRSSFVRLGGDWTDARVADLNGNGMADVIAVSNARPDIDFFNGTGTDRVSPFVVPTAHPIDRLAIGDLDGDLIADLAFTQAGAANEPVEVAVAFGSSAGPPAPGSVVARATGIAQIGTLPYSGVDAVGELFINYEQPDDAGESGSALAWLVAGGDRSLLCSIELTTFSETGSIEGAPALAVATGAFTAEDRVDALLFGSRFTGDDLSMWLVPDLRSQRARPQLLGWPYDPRFAPLSGVSGMPDGDSYVELLTGAGDLNGEGIDELVVAAPDAAGERCLISSARVAGDGPRELVAGEPVVLEVACSRAGQLAIGDLDADGAPEIVLLSGAVSGPRALHVLWNDGAGDFSADSVSVIEADADPQAFTLLRPTAETSGALAYVSEHGVHVLRAERRTFEELPAVAALELERGTGITATDVDGDGIADLVVADAGSLRVLRAELEP